MVLKLIIGLLKKNIQKYIYRLPKMGTSYFSYVKLNYIPSNCPTMII